MQGSKKIIKLCALFGSPRSDGYSAVLHEHFLGTVSGAEISRYHISSMNILPCTGCLACSEKPFCPQKDDMHLIYDALRSADIITFSFPLYFSSMPSQMKAVIDRCELLWQEKKRGAISAQTRTGTAFITAGSSYRDMFLPSMTVLSHLMNSLGGALDKEHSVLVNALDSPEGRKKYDEIIGVLKSD